MRCQDSLVIKHTNKTNHVYTPGDSEHCLQKLPVKVAQLLAALCSYVLWVK